jgi:hypothetical protein
MSEKKFIKGKWYLQEFSDVYTNVVRTNQGEGFETAWVCNIHGSSKENRPTAILISMAPEMLEQLENILDGTAFDKETGLIWEHRLEEIKNIVERANGSDSFYNNA